MTDFAPPPVVPQEPSSLGGRIVNVLVAPGEVWESIRTEAYRTSNWVVPLLIGIVAGILFVWVSFSQPGVIDEIIAQQVKAIDASVADGKMTEELAEKAREQMETMRPMMVTFGRLAGTVAMGVMAVVMQFLVALLLFLIARWGLKSAVSYWKCMEVTGLAGMVMVLGTLVTLFLVVLKGSMAANPGPILLFPDVAMGSPKQALLSSLNVFYFWWAAVLAGGLARLAGRSWAAAAFWVFGLYFLVIAAATGFAAARS
ncbi:MAG: hypothetical protein RIS76_4081 [Verrucomicrobiota bacterium]|jgi:hypothetical protein